jgi:hypothetical protein
VLRHTDTRALNAVAGVVLSAPLLPIPPYVWQIVLELLLSLVGLPCLFAQGRAHPNASFPYTSATVACLRVALGDSEPGLWVHSWAQLPPMFVQYNPEEVGAYTATYACLHAKVSVVLTIHE